MNTWECYATPSLAAARLASGKGVSPIRYKWLMEVVDCGARGTTPKAEQDRQGRERAVKAAQAKEAELQAKEAALQAKEAALQAKAAAVRLAEEAAFEAELAKEAAELKAQALAALIAAEEARIASACGISPAAWASMSPKLQGQAQHKARIAGKLKI